jgi:hypothetical protein
MLNAFRSSSNMLLLIATSCLVSLFAFDIACDLSFAIVVTTRVPPNRSRSVFRCLRLAYRMLSVKLPPHWRCPLTSELTLVPYLVADRFTHTCTRVEHVRSFTSTPSSAPAIVNSSPSHASASCSTTSASLSPSSAPASSSAVAFRPTSSSAVLDSLTSVSMDHMLPPAQVAVSVTDSIAADTVLIENASVSSFSAPNTLVLVTSLWCSMLSFQL